MPDNSTNIPALPDLESLISFPTVSSDSNVDCSRWILRRLEELGFETEWMTYSDHRGIEKACVAGCLRPSSGDHVNTEAALGRGLAYFCHTDVVPATTWSFGNAGPWATTVQDRRVYGRGSCDMKGSLACLLAAADSQNSKLTAPLFVFCTADEEIGFFGAEYVARHSKLYKEAVALQLNSIIGEPTELQVVHAHKGGRILQFTAQGKAAHSSTNEGVNANFLIIPFLNDVKTLVDAVDADPQYHDERFEPSGITLNLIINDHTPAVNITPGQCVATVYYRTMPGIDSDSIAEKLNALAEKHEIEVKEVGGGRHLLTDPKSRFVTQLLALTESQTPGTVSYGTDGGCFSDLNNLVVIGPGSIRQAHTDDEFISIDQLNLGVALYARIIDKNCGIPTPS